MYGLRACRNFGMEPTGEPAGHKQQELRPEWHHTFRGVTNNAASGWDWRHVEVGEPVTSLIQLVCDLIGKSVSHPTMCDVTVCRGQCLLPTAAMFNSRTWQKPVSANTCNDVTSMSSWRDVGMVLCHSPRERYCCRIPLMAFLTFRRTYLFLANFLPWQSYANYWAYHIFHRMWPIKKTR